jgi:hypothetical protein
MASVVEDGEMGNLFTVVGNIKWFTITMESSVGVLQKFKSGTVI